MENLSAIMAALLHVELIEGVKQAVMHFDPLSRAAVVCGLSAFSVDGERQDGFGCQRPGGPLQRPMKLSGSE